jgi:HemY protein
MPRVVFFILLVFALGLGFAWLADRPGNLVATFDGYEYQVSLMVAAVLVVAVVAAVMILWWLVKGIWNSPKTVARYFRVRRRDRGYQALSTGMIAAGAGDAAMARRKKKEAAKLISSDQEPLLHLLDAQASLLDGDHDAARAKFEVMLDDPELRLIGLRGLYLEALRLGERDVARHYAERASEAAPQLGWAADATLEARTAEGDWDAALRLVDAQKSTRQIDRESAQRRRAVLLTARAIEMVDADPAGARTAALEANRLAPELVPAAVIAAKALFRQNETRKGAKILEAAWKIRPMTGWSAPSGFARSSRTMPNPRSRWPGPPSMPASSRSRAARPRRRYGSNRARAHTCCSQTSRKPRRETRVASGSIWRARWPHRATRPG